MRYQFVRADLIRKRRLVLQAIGCSVFAATLGVAEAAWFKGNTHTHTLNSDGDAPPDTVARWYREHGYQFLVITDHEFITDPAPLNGVLGAEGKFLVMRGQEITQWLADPLHNAAHVGSINPTKVVLPIGAPRKIGATAPLGTPPGETFATNIAAIKAAGGLPQVNHPNYHWSLKPSDLFGIPDHTLLEIWNGIPDINNLGGTDDEGHFSPPTEVFWDTLLSRGEVIWGVASDDSHDYHNFDDPDPELAHPGRGWVVVRAEVLTPEAITAALEKGEFYASNGVVIDEVAISRSTYALTLRDRKGAIRYLTRFVGKDGKVLAEIPGLKPSYAVKGDEGYVRAVVTDSNGLKAWTQPLFLQSAPASKPSS